MLIDNSEKVKSSLEKQLTRALWEIGETAERNVKSMTPVVTGRLINSIHHKESMNQTVIGTDVEYAKSVEYGGERNHRPAHMFQRGVVNRVNEYKAILVKWLKS